MTTLTPLWHQCSMQSSLLCLVQKLLFPHAAMAQQCVGVPAVRWSATVRTRSIRWGLRKGHPDEVLQSTPMK